MSANVIQHRPFHNDGHATMHHCQELLVLEPVDPLCFAKDERMEREMAGLSEEDIRSRAYHLWKQAGEPAGAMDDLWYKAEAELLAERSEQGEVPQGMTDSLPV